MKQLVFSLFFFLIFFPFLLNSQEKIKSHAFTGPKNSVVEEKLFYPDLVNKFYQLNASELFWKEGRKELISSIDSAYYEGLLEKKYHIGDLRMYADSLITDSVLLMRTDRLYTDAAIALCKDIYQGYKIEPWVGYDQLSGTYTDQDNEYLLLQLLSASTADKLQLLLKNLQPSAPAYVLLKTELRRQQEKYDRDTVAMLKLSLNYYRWIHHFHFEKQIVINLPEARLRYYENDSIILDMKTVVGKMATPTPRFATVCDQVILYPYWYVPRSITFNEYLPRIKKNPAWIDANNMQVIDGSGKVMNHLNMNWSSFHAGYFPYIIRQSTGCDNALGVIKFNIVTPYGVYLHDTNNKNAFLSGLRFYSHGCIRLEEPFELGNRLLNDHLDTAFLQSCFKEQKPVFLKLEKPIPVFSVYMRAVVDINGMIHYYKDVYKLIH